MTPYKPVTDCGVTACRIAAPWTHGAQRWIPAEESCSGPQQSASLFSQLMSSTVSVRLIREQPDPALQAQSQKQMANSRERERERPRERKGKKEGRKRGDEWESSMQERSAGRLCWMKLPQWISSDQKRSFLTVSLALTKLLE